MKPEFQSPGILAKTGPLVKALVSISLLVAVSSSTRAQTLGEALNATNLTWTTSGTSGAQGWSVEFGTTHDGVSAAQSYHVFTASQTSTLQTTVTGPGTLTFWWYQSTFDGSTYSFSVNGVTQTNFNFNGLWQQKAIYFGSGTQTLKWINSGTPVSGYAYLDQVNFTQGSTAPIITSQPFSQSQVPRISTTFAVSAGGTPPLSYQWQLNSTNIDGATNSSFTLTNTQATNLGIYRVVITNSVDSLVSSNASLEFGQATAWNLPGYGRTSIPPGTTNALAVAASQFHSLILTSLGTVLACSDTYNYGEATIPAELTNALAISAGIYSSMILKSDGTVIVLGDNTKGQTNVPNGLSNVVAIASGQLHCLALKADGTVVAWGYNSDGQTNVPAGLSNVVGIGAGDNHSLAVKADGTVVAWGDGLAGETNVPPALTNAVAVAGGHIHSLALRSDGTVLAWGNNTYGQTNIPVGLSNVVAISANATHNLALKADGTMLAWGQNLLGVTNIPPNLSNVVAIATGPLHNVALVGSAPPVTQAFLSNPYSNSNGFSLTLPTQCGRVYALEYKSSLADSNWIMLPLVAGNGTNLILTDPTATNSQRLYRVRRW
jgi:hypothetical protein